MSIDERKRMWKEAYIAGINTNMDKNPDQIADNFVREYEVRFEGEKLKKLPFYKALGLACDGYKIRRKNQKSYYEVCNDRGTGWFQQVDIETGKFMECESMPFDAFDLLEAFDWEVVPEEELIAMELRRRGVK